MVKMEGSSESPAEREQRLNQIYLAIISRYKEYIEEKESLSVAELPTLVTPGNERVAQKAKEIRERFLNYDYETNFQEAASMAHEFVTKSITDIVLPLQFWLTPEETLTFMMGDTMDKGILLCSILVNLGNPSAKALIRTVEAYRDVFVYYELKNRVYVMDGSGIREYEDKQKMLDSLEINENISAYEFNNQMYSDLY
ncbi:MAG: hypothetical protein KGI06_03710 [Candidatus Micrarchaeota archaeon]|nr:hypothetical protein [Candidatus Micrarchaeota archaeon]